MKQVLVRGGDVVVEEIPVPAIGPGSILVQVAYSCVSVGTELSSVKLSGMPLYRRALKQPHNVRRFLDVARDQGLLRTVDIVRGRLAAGLPTGYSVAGTVVAVGEEVAAFAVGDRVACAGAGIANHAEYVSAPVNLAVKVPDGLDLDLASTVTLGAIALQGVRRAAPTLGESVAVIGLGILGQLTVQLLRANGCHVIGTDVDQSRVERASAAGMEHGVDSSSDDFVDRVIRLTGGFGADAVIITAASPGSQVVHQALRACRKKGRVVVVGDVGLQLNRADLYEKELDFLISTSYGPGRYDTEFEEGGRDYPIGYVRWTETRNFEEYLRLLRAGKIDISGFERETYEIDEAPAAYASLKRGGPRPMLVILSYPPRPPDAKPVVTVRTAPARAGRVRVALIGAGNFAEAMHVPNLLKLHDEFELRAVVTRTGTNAKAVSLRAGASYATTDIDVVLNDDDVDLVLITTRHDTHTPLALRALRAGKNVFVEKPLALTSVELGEIAAFFDGRDRPLLMTGFNRRFAPAIATARELLARRTTPMIVSYRLNAGYLPPEHWVHGPEGGGRNIGEACHVYDLFGALTGARVADVDARAIETPARQWARNDNFVATVGFTDGSVCTLVYTALGSRDYPKERMDAFADGSVLTIDDYRTLTVSGARRTRWSSRTIEKGHREELEALGRCLHNGGPWPISLEDQLQAMRIAFRVEELIRSSVAAK